MRKGNRISLKGAAEAGRAAIERLAIGLLPLALMAGCNSDQQKLKDEIDAGEVALGGYKYDVAVSDADEAIHLKPTAQGYYVRARAEEERPKPNAYITTADLAKSRADYQAALDLHPERPLAARCRSGLASVAFMQEDYAEAISQWNASLGDLEEPTWQAEALYRIGVCQQRIGRFDEADKTFVRVIDQYPDEDVAAKATARRGIRQFYVQVADCSSLTDAQAAVEQASSAGLTCRQVSDQGLYAVRAGPYTTYAQARAAQGAAIGTFPEAIIVP